jgi:hypothetical protein
VIPCFQSLLSNATCTTTPRLLNAVAKGRGGGEPRAGTAGKKSQRSCGGRKELTFGRDARRSRRGLYNLYSYAAEDATAARACGYTCARAEQTPMEDRLLASGPARGERSDEPKAEGRCLTSSATPLACMPCAEGLLAGRSAGGFSAVVALVGIGDNLFA